ncbi:hypothetical protein HYDPIDRAFT_118131 [Hydnomerulius pinastri MD-312]|uniref:Uncharacterized protein n=1 Tax=Hydnomerulius pinastri MD-312 TaxID=994086 RepID=A0A0C9VQ12_9AGAM|nr:hypothetical protein HYDPIDRAFT_118131 [Hydnomerulius pinastri MD-312]
MVAILVEVTASPVISIVKSRLRFLNIIQDTLLLLLLPQFQYPASLSPARSMSGSPQKRSASINTRASGVLAPVSHMLGNKLRAFAKSRLPVPNKPKVRATQRRAFITAAPIPFAPILDTHAFQPPPPYSARPDDSTEFLTVPNNTPEASPPAPTFRDVKSSRDKYEDNSFGSNSTLSL